MYTWFNCTRIRVKDTTTFDHRGVSNLLYCSQLLRVECVVEICEGVEVIRVGAFHVCEYIESIAFPSTLTLIEWNAFRKCTRRLKRVELSDGLESIGEGRHSAAVNLLRASNCRPVSLQLNPLIYVVQSSEKHQDSSRCSEYYETLGICGMRLFEKCSVAHEGCARGIR